MIEILICGYNIFCHLRNFESHLQRNKYPSDVAQLCYYFEEQKSELPDYCKSKTEITQPRRRSDF